MTREGYYDAILWPVFPTLVYLFEKVSRHLLSPFSFLFLSLFFLFTSEYFKSLHAALSTRSPVTIRMQGNVVPVLDRVSKQIVVDHENTSDTQTTLSFGSIV